MTCILISLIIGGTSITLALGNLDNKQCINIFSTLSPITSQADGIYVTQGEKRYDNKIKFREIYVMFERVPKKWRAV